MASKLIPEFDCLPPKFWSQLTPQQFEEFCGDILAFMFPQTAIDDTPYSGDGGKDYIIRHYTSNDEPGFIVNFAEAKRHKEMNLKDISRSVISALKDNDCKRLLILISANLRLSVLSEIYQVVQQKKIKLTIIHNAHLTSLLTDSEFREQVEKNWLIHTVERDYDYQNIVQQKIPPVTCCYQYFINNDKEKTKAIRPISTSQVVLRSDDELILSILISNMSAHKKTITVHHSKPIQTYWQPIAAPDERELAPYSTEIFEYKVKLVEQVQSKLPTLEVLNHENPYANNIIIYSDALAEPYFRLPLIGAKAKQYCHELESILNSFIKNNEGGAALIRGQAGTGKSRLVEETLQSIQTTNSISNNIFIERQLVIEQGTGFKDIAKFTKTFANDLLASHTGPNDPDKFLERIDSQDTKTLLAKQSKLEKDELAKLKNTAKCLADILFLHKPKPVLLLLDDLHHSDFFVTLWLNEIISNLKDANDKLFVIFSGRNDDTFINPQFDTIANQLEFLATNDLSGNSSVTSAFHFYEVNPLEEQETKILIETIFVEGLSDEALNKITKLSENIPFNIIQITEYLCESEIAVLNNKRTYSIENDEFFSTAEGFPKKIGDIFKERLKMLKQEAGSDKLNLLLTVIALMSNHISWEKLQDLCKLLSINENASLLQSRNFIVSKNNQLRFSHENIRHYLTDKNINGVTILRKAAQQIARNKELITNIIPWMKCRIFWWSKSYTRLLKVAAQERGEGDVQALSSKNNLRDSTKVFDYACLVYELDKDLSPDKTAKYMDMLYLKGYASKFTQNYWQTIKTLVTAIEKMEQQLQSNPQFNNEQNQLKLAKLNQMAGHTAQNCKPISITHDYLIKAQSTLFQLAKIEFQPPFDQKRTDYLELKYDNQDRTRKNHLFMGNLAEAERTLEQAKNAAQAKQDKFLAAIAGLSEAELYFVHDPEKAFQLWQANDINIKNGADDRIKMTYELIKIQEIILCQKLSQIEIEAKLTKLSNKTDSNGWVGPQPKIALLNGLSKLIAGDLKSCCDDFKQAHGIAEQNGYIMFKWMSLNNWALALDVLGDKVQAIAKIKTAVKIAKEQEFLQHLHEEPICFFQNALIHNYLNILECKQSTRIEIELNKLDIKYEQLPTCKPAHNLFKLPKTDQYMMTFI